MSLMTSQAFLVGLVLRGLQCYIYKDTVNFNWPVFLFSCSSVHYSLIITLFLTACDDVRFSEVQVFLVWTTVGFYLCLDSSVTLGPLYTDEVVICD